MNYNNILYSHLSDEVLQKFANLKIGECDIIAQVVKVDPIRNFVKGEGKLFRIELFDNDETIEMLFYNEYTKFRATIEV